MGLEIDVYKRQIKYVTLIKTQNDASKLLLPLNQTTPFFI